jgi:hypothetical protein
MSRATREVAPIAFSEIKAEDLFRDLPDLITLDQAAKELGVGRTKKYELLDIFLAKKDGKHYLISKRHLAEYVVATLTMRRTKKNGTKQSDNSEAN